MVWLKYQRNSYAESGSHYFTLSKYITMFQLWTTNRSGNTSFTEDEIKESKEFVACSNICMSYLELCWGYNRQGSLEEDCIRLVYTVGAEQSNNGHLHTGEAENTIAALKRWMPPQLQYNCRSPGSLERECPGIESSLKDQRSQNVMLENCNSSSRCT